MKANSDRPRNRPRARNRAAIASVILTALASSWITSSAEPPTSPSHVQVQLIDDRYRLTINNRPFYIKGAGIELGSLEKLRAHGGNSFRTWSTQNGRDSGKTILDRALTNGLYVAMGLDVDHERRGFDYDNTNAVARQSALLTGQVTDLKDHPALLLWVIGNELNFEKNPKVWDAVNDISKKIHAIDPNHPTTTTLAGFNKETADLVRSRAPDLDFICFQMYSDIINLPRYLRESGWDKPYIVTEWGATGHWECGKTAWGAPMENDSTTKANLYQVRFEKVIQSDQKLCLGSYVFFWGQKQERTPTWYGMFLKSGEETAPVDVMHLLWTGAWPQNRSPVLHGVLLDGKRAEQNIHLKAGEFSSARVDATDPDHDPLRFFWEVLEESTARTIGGDRESVPNHIPNLITNATGSQVLVQAPAKPGAYRLFSYVFDDKGHAAHANIPFYVDAPGEAIRTNTAQLSKRHEDESR
jgi:hypothetical protein